METLLREVHLQLTVRCNLHCPFCGQWGKKGFFRSGKLPEELSPDEWKRVIASIARESSRTGVMPQFTVWGGEPTLSPNFVPVLKELHDHGFDVGVVTNGARLEEYADAVNAYVKALYFSIDGFEATHDSVRGVPGTFARLLRGLRKIDGRVRQLAMTVICEANYRELAELPLYLKERIPNLSTMILAQMMFLTEAEAEEQHDFARKYLDGCAGHAGSWVYGKFGPYVEELPEICKKIAASRYPLEVRLSPPHLPLEKIVSYYRETPLVEKCSCEMPFSHINVKSDGRVMSCVDFDDYSLGSVRERDVMEIFRSPAAEQYRAAVTGHVQPYCRRCTWRTQHPKLDL